MERSERDIIPQRSPDTAENQHHLGIKEEVPPELQGWTTRVDQEGPESPLIKEEEEGLSITKVEEDVKTECVETLLSPQLHLRHFEENGEDRGEPEPARSFSLDGHVGQRCEDETENSSESDNNEDDWEETSGPTKWAIMRTGEKLNCYQKGEGFSSHPFLLVHDNGDVQAFGSPGGSKSSDEEQQPSSRDGRWRDGDDSDEEQPRSRSPHCRRLKTEGERGEGVPQWPLFTPKRPPGVQHPLNTENPTPGEIFSHFLDDELLKVLCGNTNSNAARKHFFWTAVTPQEMEKFIGMLMFMSILRLPKISDYWRQETIFSVPFPATIMSRNRFMAILSVFHLSDPDKDNKNEMKKGAEDYDCLHWVRPFMEAMCVKCKAFYHPGQHLVVDERMVATKVKPTKWGLKFFVLADTDGYTFDFKLYTDESKVPSGKGLSLDVVRDLVNKDHLGSGYIVYTDSSYTSPPLFKHLNQQGFGDYETCRRGRARRWPTIVFQHLVNIAATNAFVIHTDRCATVEQEPMTRQCFQEELAAHLLGVSLKKGIAKIPGAPHLPVPTSRNQPKAQRASRGRRRCKRCHRNTAWMCEVCNVGLCLLPDRNCHWLYHQDM